MVSTKEGTALGTMGKAVSAVRMGGGGWRQGPLVDLMPSLSRPLPAPQPQENYELHQVELGPGSVGTWAAKMSKKKAASGGGKREGKAENMKKEMEIVSRGWAGLAEGKGGARETESECGAPPCRMTTSCQCRS